MNVSSVPGDISPAPYTPNTDEVTGPAANRETDSDRAVTASTLNGAGAVATATPSVPAVTDSKTAEQSNTAPGAGAGATASGPSGAVTMTVSNNSSVSPSPAPAQPPPSSTAVAAVAGSEAKVEATAGGASVGLVPSSSNPLAVATGWSARAAQHAARVTKEQILNTESFLWTYMWRLWLCGVIFYNVLLLPLRIAFFHNYGSETGFDTIAGTECGWVCCASLSVALVESTVKNNCRIDFNVHLLKPLMLLPCGFSLCNVVSLVDATYIIDVIVTLRFAYSHRNAGVRDVNHRLPKLPKRGARALFLC